MTGSAANALIFIIHSFAQLYLLERAGLRVLRFSSDVQDYPIELILRRAGGGKP